MQQNYQTYETLYQQIAEINVVLNELKNKQTEEVNLLKKNHIANMKKLDKLQEYNKIADMTNQIFEKRLSSIENSLMQISKSMNL